MKIIRYNQPINIYLALDRFAEAGIHVITIRANGKAPGNPLALSAEIVLDDSADIAAAQAILDSIDLIAEQAAVDAEKVAERTRAEKLQALAEWLRTQSKDVREKFADLQAELDATRQQAQIKIGMNRTHIEWLEGELLKIKPQLQPPSW